MFFQKREYPLTAENVKKAVVVAGRGAEVLRDVAGIQAELLDGKHHPCPNCGGKDRFRVVDVRAGEVFCNHGCFGGRKKADVLAVVQTMRDVTFSEAVQMVAEYVGVKALGDNLRDSHFSFSKKHYVKNETENEKIVKKPPCKPKHDLVPEKPKAARKPVRVTHYDYEDGAGLPHLRVTRWDYADGTKEVRPSHWDAERGEYVPGIAGQLRVPFNAVEVKEAEIVFFVEGEKCAAALKAYLTQEVLAEMNPPCFPDEVAVTCVIGGVNGFTQELAVWFLGKTVYILPDHDNPGYRFAWEVKRKIEQAAVKHERPSQVTVFRWQPETPEKWDIADALEEYPDDVNHAVERSYA